MCLILFAWEAHTHYQLVVGANRDEFHARPAAAAAFWDDEPGLLAGRDLQAGGTWLGVTRSGRFAAITNYREPLAPEIRLEKSRGHLVRDFLVDNVSASRHAEQLVDRGSSYRGFNLLLGTPDVLAYVSNRGAGPAAVSEGIHGLSNHLLNTEWPKVHTGKNRLESLLEAEHVAPEALFELLTDRSLAPGDMPADIESGQLQEHLMNHYFIVSPQYGTRSSTVLLISRDGDVQFLERQFNPDGTELDTRRFEFNYKES